MNPESVIFLSRLFYRRVLLCLAELVLRVPFARFGFLVASLRRL